MDSLKELIMKTLSEAQIPGMFADPNPNFNATVEEAQTHLKNYHLHNMVWLAAQKLGDDDLATKHITKAQDAHLHANSLIRHMDGGSTELFTKLKQNAKREAYEGLD